MTNVVQLFPEKLDSIVGSIPYSQFHLNAVHEINECFEDFDVPIRNYTTHSHQGSFVVWCTTKKYHEILMSALVCIQRRESLEQVQLRIIDMKGE